MAVIYITRKDGTRQKYRLPAEPGSIISIGRDENCVVSMPDVVGLSGRHCTIRREGQVYVIADNHSTNGTLCDGEPITESVMRRSAVYSLGEATLVFDPEISAAPKIDLAALAEDERREEEQAREAARTSPDADKSSSTEPSPRADGTAAEAETRDRGLGTSGRDKGADIRRDAASGDSSSRQADSGPEGAESASARKLPAVPQGPSHRTDEAPVAPRLRVPAGARRRARGLRPVAEAAAPRSGLVRLLITVYVLLVLGGAFYAGLTLRYWWETGRYLPTDGPALTPSSAAGESLVSPALSPAAAPAGAAKASATPTTATPTAATPTSATTPPAAPTSPSAGSATAAPTASGNAGSATPQGASATPTAPARGATSPSPIPQAPEGIPAAGPSTNAGPTSGAAASSSPTARSGIATPASVTPPSAVKAAPARAAASSPAPTSSASQGDGSNTAPTAPAQGS